MAYIVEHTGRHRLRQRLLRIFLVLPALLALFAACDYSATAQIYTASPANWLFPNGSPEGTRYTKMPSGRQSVDSFSVKWATGSISGDVQPLIGNIVNNPPLFSQYPYSPNEICAVVSGKIVVVDAYGRTHKLGKSVQYVNSISCLFDTTQKTLNYMTGNPVILGIELIERSAPYDSLAFAYLGGFDNNADTVALIQRMAIDLRQFKDNNNISASIKPIFGLPIGETHSIFSIVNMSKPEIVDTFAWNAQYFRGFTRFRTSSVYFDYPMPDVGDDEYARIYLGPEANFGQPTMTKLQDNRLVLSLPSYPSIEPANIQVPGLPKDFVTFSDRPYLTSLFIGDEYTINPEYTPYDLSTIFDATSKRPVVNPYYVHLTDVTGADSVYLLVTEQYKGVEGSDGTSRLHLFRTNGDSITYSPDGFEEVRIPTVNGGKNHLWSVAVGNVDGASWNNWGSYLPNNPGAEIIATQTSRDFQVADSKLFVMRYKRGDRTPKASPPNTYLYPFDTIYTCKMSGWIAAVNDLDGGDDGKEEIIIADGAKLKVFRQRNYYDTRFRLGDYFDTVLIKTFPNEVISNVAVADIEGDGFNDIIVTTFDSTYVIGAVIPRIISVMSPKNLPTPAPEFCPKDTVSIVWRNILRGSSTVNIVFQPTAPSGPRRIVFSGYANVTDTVEFRYAVDSSVIGFEGYFIVESAGNPTKVFDTTSIMKFNYPFIKLDDAANMRVRVGSSIKISGDASCLDSLAIEVSTDSLRTWTKLASTAVATSGRFSIDGPVPCMNFFDCSAASADTVVYARLISYRWVYTDTSSLIPVTISPALFPVSFDTACKACPHKEFTWDATAIPFPCDSVVISISADGGKTFGMVDKISSAFGRYLWKAALNTPDSLIFAFCCENSCVRTDTLIRHLLPKIINIVAPNPFNPPDQQIEVVYEVPIETVVNVKIYDQNNRLVAHPVKDATRLPSTAYCDRWNGLLWDGSTVSNGLFYLSIELSNGIREVYPIYVKK